MIDCVPMVSSSDGYVLGVNLVPVELVSVSPAPNATHSTKVPNTASHAAGHLVIVDFFCTPADFLQCLHLSG